MEIRDYLRLLIRARWIILSVFIVTLAATAAYTERQPDVYTARATFVARLKRDFTDERYTAAALDILNRSTEISTTYSEVAKSRRIRFFAGERLALDADTRRGLIVSSRVLPGTNLIEISAEGLDPALVRDYANVVGEETIKYVYDLYGAYELVPLDEAIAPFSPSRPQKTFNYILGGLVGLVLGAGIAFLSASLSTPEKTEEYQEPGGELPAPLISQEIQQLRQELGRFQLQFEQTQKQMEQTRNALQSTQKDVEKAHTSMRSLVKQMDNHQLEEADHKKG